MLREPQDGGYSRGFSQYEEGGAPLGIEGEKVCVHVCVRVRVHMHACVREKEGR